MNKKFNFGAYIPKAYRELATEEERSFSEWVINFKDGQKAQLKEGAQMVIGKLRQWYGDKARELVVVPVPCSSMAQYRFRFSSFLIFFRIFFCNRNIKFLTEFLVVKFN